MIPYSLHIFWSKDHENLDPFILKCCPKNQIHIPSFTSFRITVKFLFPLLPLLSSLYGLDKHKCEVDSAPFSE